MSSTPQTRLVAEGLSCTLPDGRVLFRQLDISFGRERTGLIGPNGSGKTTLLRLLAGELRPAAGQVHRSARLGFLRQHVRPAPAATLAQVLGVRDRLEALDRLEAGGGTARDLEVLGDDWSLRERIASVLADFDLAHLDPQRPVGTLSGGEATRVALAGLTLEAPDYLLLDEPTNHLDRDGRDAVERFVAEWPGGLVCVSHDRTLLRRMDRILELSATGARSFGGNYDAYVAARAAEEAAAARELDSARAALREAERTAREVTERQARRSARGRSSRETANLPKILLNNRRSQAEQTSARLRATSEREVGERQSRLRQARARVEERARPRFEVASTLLPAGRTVLELDRVSWRPPGAARALLQDLSLRLVGPERVAVTGPNGAGKSSLLRLATGRLRPDAGAVRGTARTAFLDQRGVRLAPELSVLDNFRRRHPGMEESRARHALARFLFAHEAALRAAGTLSGGQRLRASLACVLGGERPPELLVLDEPTNHLDLDAIAALESALRAYDGALLVVSHDPYFLAAAGVQRELVLG